MTSLKPWTIEVTDLPAINTHAIYLFDANHKSLLTISMYGNRDAAKVVLAAIKDSIDDGFSNKVFETGAYLTSDGVGQTNAKVG